MATAKKKSVVKPNVKASENKAPKKVVKKVAPSAKKSVSKKVTAKPATKTKAAPKTKAATKKKTTTKAAEPKKIIPAPFISTLNAEALPVRLQTIVDKSEISDIIFSVGRGLDRVDETILRSVWHPDATVDMGPGTFQGTGNDYVVWVLGVMGQIRESHHLIGNVHVTLEHDVALVESYCHAHFRVEKPTGREDVFIGSRFLDRMERRPSDSSGVWKIVHRKQVIDWVRTEAVSDLFYHKNPDALWSYRNKTDPSYQMRQFPGNNQTSQKLPAFLGHRYDSKSIKF